jgi:hypothetical protein
LGAPNRTNMASAALFRRSMQKRRVGSKRPRARESSRGPKFAPLMGPPGRCDGGGQGSIRRIVGEQAAPTQSPSTRGAQGARPGGRRGAHLSQHGSANFIPYSTRLMQKGRAGDLAQRGSVMRRGRSLLWHTGVRAVFLLRIRSTPCPAASSARPRRLPSPALHAEAEAEPTRRFRPPSAAFPAGREASVWASMAARDKTGRLSHGRRTNRPWPRTTLDPNRARLDRQIPERHRGARKPEREDERQKSPISAMQSKSYVGT